ncbi:MAG: glutamine--fructose-6-phosphate transaminase (isomerizing) [Acidobacteria bacterium]|nr:MAG: glutamine--fructose-6-phosphate transaminase (isomerizing) [Acidobacteriota bacterium]PIE90959.1 MAG: glutamine--fructose-6-phosphate transaminase (isomerizing) [Acidobacteriota bacterium]
MCGIVGYIGPKKASAVLLNGLKRLEYRGYDSAGFVVLNKNKARRFRAVGQVKNLDSLVRGKKLPMSCGIAHTRWATHGKPTEANAHPHSDHSGEFHLVHNGIIENHDVLKRQLQSEGTIFQSETDSEVLVHLIAKFYAGDLENAVRESLLRVEGTFGIAVVCKHEPGKIVCARRGSPVILGLGNGEMFVASDVSAIVNYTDQVIYLEDNEMAVLTSDEYQILSLDNKPVNRESCLIDWELGDMGLGSYPHYMLKEIYEQPRTVENAIRGRILVNEGVSVLGGLQACIKEIQKLKKLIIVSCGTSYHAGMVGRYIFDELTDLEVEVEFASEFRYRKLRIDETAAVLAISQSGETIDTLAAVREAKRKGALTIGLVNVVGSTIARETDVGVYCHAGPEIGVASTKIFVSQLVILNLIALLIGRYGSVSLSEGIELLKAIKKLPGKIQEILEKTSKIQEMAEKFYQSTSFFFLGRQLHFPIALEGALKLKEISYIHAEGYAAGEMKHGPISLIEQQFPTFVIAPKDATYEKIYGNIQEIKARSGKILVIAEEGDNQIQSICDEVFYIPQTHHLLKPILSIIPLQLFSYYCADLRGCEIDKPRNLAKSVTVE